MTNIPIRTQILPNNSLASVQACIRDGKQVAGEDILFTIEQSIERQLPEAVQNIVRRAIIPAVKTRGRPSKFGASLDLALERVDQRYPALLRYEQRKKDRLLKSGKAPEKGESPSLLAYNRLLKPISREFGAITREALRNMHSEWRNGHFHSAGSHVDSEDYDAEIERLFPAVSES
jgi:hypothetical protein